MEGEYTSDFNIPLLVYWRASVCLEFFYSLFSDRREIFYSLHLIQTSGGDMDFFNLITTAAVDFATASASCKRGILSVVRFCESETMADPLNNTSDISKESVFFEHLGDFAIHRIYPTTIAKSREFLKVSIKMFHEPDITSLGISSSIVQQRTLMNGVQSKA